MRINPYLMFNGRCEEAFKFYEQCFGGKAEMIRYEGSPAANDVPADWRNKILHARLVVDSQVIMASDAPPGRYSQPSGFSVSLSFEDPAQAEHVWKPLSQDGHIIMPFQETFWAQRFGMVVDRFGIPWMVNCEKHS